YFNGQCISGGGYGTGILVIIGAIGIICPVEVYKNGIPFRNTKVQEAAASIRFGAIGTICKGEKKVVFIFLHLHETHVLVDGQYKGGVVQVKIQFTILPVERSSLCCGGHFKRLTLRGPPEESLHAKTRIIIKKI